MFSEPGCYVLRPSWANSGAGQWGLSSRSEVPLPPVWVSEVCIDLLPSFHLHLDRCSPEVTYPGQGRTISKDEDGRGPPWCQGHAGLPPLPPCSFPYSATNIVDVSSCPDCAWCQGQKDNWSLPSWVIPASEGRETDGTATGGGESNNRIYIYICVCVYIHTHTHVYI